MGDLKGGLQEEVQMRLRYLTKDCRTIFKIRHDHKDWYHGDHGDRPIGGGNFLTAIGLLSALNFAAKVHLHLVEPTAFVTDTDRQAVKDAIARIAEIEGLKAIAKGDKTSWMAPRVGSCNEDKAFLKFIAALRPTIDLGMATNDEASDVWRCFRNALAHMAWPQRGGIYVLRSESSSEEAEKILFAGPKVFWKKEYRSGLYEWLFNVDRLMLEMPGISTWLDGKIEACPNEAQITGILKWMGKA